MSKAAGPPVPGLPADPAGWPAHAVALDAHAAATGRRWPADEQTAAWLALAAAAGEQPDLSLARTPGELLAAARARALLAVHRPRQAGTP